jgi:hypothetical protein
MSELLGSGMPKTSIEWQMFTHARPGVTDTSAISHDQVNNPGDDEFDHQPVAARTVSGRGHQQVAQGEHLRRREGREQVLVRARRDGKCWVKSTRSDDTTLGRPGVHHILKGGEDSIGGLEAIQRVYFNIGSCAEACWVNHLTDFRQVDPAQRGFGQSAFSIGQCRRDCPHFRAIEDA